MAHNVHKKNVNLPKCAWAESYFSFQSFSKQILVKERHRYPKSAYLIHCCKRRITHGYDSINMGCIIAVGYLKSPNSGE